MSPAGRVQPLDASRWSDIELLFGERGACAGCWCMYWRRSASVWESGKGASNRRAFRSLVSRGATPGLIGYRDDAPVAWCALAPRSSYPRLERSRILRPVDELAVWSISCLFVLRSARRQGWSVRMLRAAADFVRESGGRVVEGYPVEPTGERAPDAFLWTGTASAFRRAGYREVLRRSPTRPIMRRNLRPRG